jgi:Flp pilus assembly protein TadG
MYPYVLQKDQRGQSLTELAISTLFFFVIVFGALDIGRAYFVYVALEDSAGEGAVFLSINPQCATAANSLDANSDGDFTDSDDLNCADPGNGEYRAFKAAQGYFNWDRANVQVSYPTGGKGVGNTVQVQIAYSFTLFTPIISQIVGDDTLTITSVATQTILMES